MSKSEFAYAREDETITFTGVVSLQLAASNHFDTEVIEFPDSGVIRVAEDAPYRIRLYYHLEFTIAKIRSGLISLNVEPVTVIGYVGDATIDMIIPTYDINGGPPFSEIGAAVPAINDYVGLRDQITARVAQEYAARWYRDHPDYCDSRDNSGV